MFSAFLVDGVSYEVHVEQWFFKNNGSLDNADIRADQLATSGNLCTKALRRTGSYFEGTFPKCEDFLRPDAPTPAPHRANINCTHMTFTNMGSVETYRIYRKFDLPERVKPRDPMCPC
ncbi:hypothetical protein Btru_076279 [Bulinus truncatus]|nr:hypothetical protein Btru_076279 [Bulinus truncatus]